MTRTSWSGWIQSEPQLRSVKQKRRPGDEQTALYVDITCPHCGDVIEAFAASAAKNKSNICKAHLASKKCNLPESQRDGLNANVLSLPPSRRGGHREVLHQNCVSRDEFRQAVEEGRRAIATSKKEAKCEAKQEFAQMIVTAFPQLGWLHPVAPESVVPQLTRIVNAPSTALVPVPTAVASRERALEGELEAARNELHSLRRQLRAAEDDRTAQVRVLKQQLASADSESRARRAQLQRESREDQLVDAFEALQAFAGSLLHDLNADLPPARQRSMNEFHAFMRARGTCAGSPRPLC